MLLYAVGTRAFERRVGVVAGLLAALYGLFVFYDVELMKAAFDVFFASAALLLLLRAADARGTARAGWLAALGAGAALGLLVQVRGNIALFVPLAALWLWLALRGGGRRVALVRGGALIAGVLAVHLLPLALRAGMPEERELFARGTGIHLYIGNHAGANGSYSRIPGVRATAEGHVVDAARVASAAEGRALSAGEVSRYWMARGLAWIAGNPLDFLALSGRKLALFVNAYEIPSNEDFYFTARFSPVLQLPLVRFGWIAPLGLLGAALAWRRGAGARLLMLLVAATALSMTLLFVTGRYRMTAAPPLIVLAAFALVWLFDRARARALRPLALALPALAALVAGVHAPSGLSAARYMRSSEGQLRSALPDALPDARTPLPERPPAAPPRATGGPIVLVAIDTLRADRVACYGHAFDTAPALCALAREGLLFERAFTPRPQTTPALASLLTGLPPHRHGVEQLYQLLPPQAETLAERLREAGWRTAAFVSSFVMLREMSGLEQGFERYDDTLTRREASRESFERRADETLARALAWLDAQPDGRFFLFVHWIDPHGPYTPALEDARRFVRPRGERVPAVPAYQRLPGVERLGQFAALYDGEIASADRALAQLVAALRARGLYDAATLAVTADHGESFGEEERWLEHGHSLAEAETRVPLVLKPAAGFAAPLGRRVESAVSLEDLYPTLLGAAGLLPRDGAASRRDLLAPAPDDDETGVAMSSLEGSLGWSAVVRGDRCALRFVLPRPDASARRARERSEGVEGNAACRAELAARALPRLDDLAGYRRPFPVTMRGDALEPGFRASFVARRGDPIVPLDEAERARLRSLGYLE